MWVGSIEACPFFFRRCFGSSVKKSVETVQLCCWTSQGQTEKETVTITSIIPIILLIGSPIIIINHKCPFHQIKISNWKDVAWLCQAWAPMTWFALNPTNYLEIIQKEAASKRIFTRLSMSNEIPSVGSPQLLGWISRSDPLKERRAKQLNSLRHSIPDHPNQLLIIIRIYLVCMFSWRKHIYSM